LLPFLIARRGIFFNYMTEVFYEYYVYEFAAALVYIRVGD